MVNRFPKEIMFGAQVSSGRNCNGGDTLVHQYRHVAHRRGAGLRRAMPPFMAAFLRGPEVIAEAN
jgi:hypothetical protein